MTMDTYGHLFPSRDGGWVNKLDDARTGVESNPHPPRTLMKRWKSSRVLSRWKIWWRCPGVNGRPAAY